jgi:hypothetical protein
MTFNRRTWLASLDLFTRVYMETLLWAEEDQLGDATVGDLSETLCQSIKTDCARFQADNALTLEAAYNLGKDYNEGHAGGDFCLTRNGHGSGFWSRDLGVIGETLSKACEQYPVVDIYLGDDGLVY